MPALPLDEAGKYVAAAYLIFTVLLLIYVSIIGAKIARISKELGELLELEEAGQSPAVQASRDGEPPSPRAGQDALPS